VQKARGSVATFITIKAFTALFVAALLPGFDG